MPDVEKVIAEVARIREHYFGEMTSYEGDALDAVLALLKKLTGKYEYHIDHTDCIWYTAGGKSMCPVTCSQYRDGWNDAMRYMLKDDHGYAPYKRGGEADARCR